MMSTTSTEDCIRFLDEIIESRRSIRSFKKDIPSKDAIKAIIRAGLFAPYAGAALDQKDFRHFVVIQKGSQAMTSAGEMMQRHVKAMSEQLSLRMQGDPALQSKAQKFAKRLEVISREGAPGVGTAPYFIVVAEKKGFPPVEQQSLAHCLQNMWLKATALGLGFHLVSATAEMAKDKEFCGLLGIPFGEFELNGCAVGYPSKQLPPAQRQNVEEVTSWLD
jgi:nitroreductase